MRCPAGKSDLATTSGKPTFDFQRSESCAMHRGDRAFGTFLAPKSMLIDSGQAYLDARLDVPCLVGSSILGTIHRSGHGRFPCERFWVDSGQISACSREGTWEKLGWHCKPCYPSIYWRWSSNFRNSNSYWGPGSQRCRSFEKWQYCANRRTSSEGWQLYGQRVFRLRWGSTSR